MREGRSCDFIFAFRLHPPFLLFLMFETVALSIEIDWGKHLQALVNLLMVLDEVESTNTNGTTGWLVTLFTCASRSKRLLFFPKSSGFASSCLFCPCTI